MSLDELVKAVNSIKNDDDINAIVQNCALNKVDRAGKSDQILGIYKGVVDGKSITLTHRWYDTSGPFSMQPDCNKLLLEVDNQKLAEGDFLEDF